MQINNISDYMVNYITNLLTQSNISSVNKTYSTGSALSLQADKTASFDDYFNSYMNTTAGKIKHSQMIDSMDYKDIIGIMQGVSSKAGMIKQYSQYNPAQLYAQYLKTDTRSALQVAQDAYSQLLSLSADAISGRSTTTSSTASAVTSAVTSASTNSLMNADSLASSQGLSAL